MANDICVGYIRCSIVALIYVLLIISAPIYLLQMITILRHRKPQFATQFFTFLKMNAVCDGVSEKHRYFEYFPDPLVVDSHLHVVPVDSMVLHPSRCSTRFVQ